MVLSVPRFVVLGGAGAIGRIIVRDLFGSQPKNQILIADFHEDSARQLAAGFRSRRVAFERADARDPSQLARIFRGHSVVINCTRHQFNLNVMKAALASHVHYLDLGGLFVWTRRQLRLNSQFARAGLTAILGMGCSPGLTNVMAAAAVTKLGKADSIRIRVGGIDFNTQQSSLAFPYSAQTIVEELTLKPWKWSGGKFVKAAPRSGWERMDFGPPVGPVWLVTTRHSEIATLPLRYKTLGLRYADFKVGFERSFVREIIKRLRAGWTVRDFEALPSARNTPKDYEITRVIVRGGRRRIIADCHAESNAEWNASAGDIDTACPASIVAQMIVSGVVSRPGVSAPEDVVPPETLFDECRSRGMQFRMAEESR